MAEVRDEDLDLGERDDTEQAEFPPSERLIHTQAYDLSINTLKEQWDDGILQIPDFQREYVWDNAKASRLIESLLLNIPIPVLFFAETADAKYQVVDGHQRIKSVVRYLENEFPLSGLRIQAEFKGLRFFSATRSRAAVSEDTGYACYHHWCRLGVFHEIRSIRAS
jgi:hypothetical protein